MALFGGEKQRKEEAANLYSQKYPYIRFFILLFLNQLIYRLKID